MKSLIAPSTLVAVFVLFVLIAPFLVRSRWWISHLLLLIFSAGIFYLLLLLPSGYSYISALRLVDDGVSRILILTAFGVTFFTGLVSIDYRRRNILPSGEMAAMLFASLTGALITSMAGDILLFVVGIELTSIPVYVLTGILRRRERPLEAGMKYLLLGGLSTAIMFYGTGLLYFSTGTTSITGLIDTIHLTSKDPVLYAGFFFLFAGIAFKASLAPFHMWTPDVYQGAPTPFTAFMSAVVKFVAFIGFIRLFSLINFIYEVKILLIGLSILSMVWGNVAALVQEDVKRMLAYSSVAHAGYALIPFLSGRKEGLIAGIFYLVVYSLMVSGAFGVISYNEEKEGEGTTYESLSGLALKKPLLGFCAIIIFFALTGLPPTGGFTAKFFAFKSAIDSGLWWLAFIGIITSMVGAYYYLRVIVVMYMQENGVRKILPSRPLTLAGVLLFTLLILAYGIDPGSLLQVVQSATEVTLKIFY